MALKLVNDDFVLPLTGVDYAARASINRYEPFLEAISLDRYAFQREAIRRALLFLASANYPQTWNLASEHFEKSPQLQAYFGSQVDYLQKFPLGDRKAASLDLATGTGKSFVLYGIARLALAMGLVDKVLVLCPSLTIEEGLKDKFRQLSARQDLKQIMESLGAVHPNPPIKSANDPILDGDICVENIHAVYDRTGSSISDSFKGKGSRSLVLNDEAHHIYSGVDSGTKKWLGFLRNEEYGFRSIIGVSGTPYTGNDYFPDVLFRYGLKQAIDDAVVKRPDYVTARLIEGGTSYAELFDNHRRNWNTYGHLIKPISVVVTEKIVKCVGVWKQLVDHMTATGFSRQEAEKRVIWVASGIPSGADGARVKALVPDPEKMLKRNLQLLRSVGDSDNPVEWIVSVSMLTEGWDVANVFQIVPWETKAFNSKLLITQVLGRGLRVPPGVHDPKVIVANHERWTTELKKLFEEVLEVENRISSVSVRPQFSFPLFNLRYATEQVTVQTSKARAREPDGVSYLSQAQKVTQQTTYSLSGNRTMVLDVPELMKVDDAAARIQMFLDDKDEAIAAAWPKARIRDFIVNNLAKAGEPADFITKENLTKTQNAFGPLFRSVGSTVPRQKLRPDALMALDPIDLPAQSISEDQLRHDTTVYFTEDAANGFPQPGERALWENWVEDRQIALRRPLDEIAHLPKAMKAVETSVFKCPTNLLVARYEPERKFADHVFANADLFDAFFKNSDMGFYSFPYSFKAEEHASTHARTENFNPDFFLKLTGRNTVLVVEIKMDGDDNGRNRAKMRDGDEHFKQLNAALSAAGEPWQYHFYFMSESDYAAFFAAIREKRAEFVSSLMAILRKSA